MAIYKLQTKISTQTKKPNDKHSGKRNHIIVGNSNYIILLS